MNKLITFFPPCLFVNQWWVGKWLFQNFFFTYKCFIAKIPFIELPFAHIFIIIVFSQAISATFCKNSTSIIINNSHRHFFFFFSEIIFKSPKELVFERGWMKKEEVIFKLTNLTWFKKLSFKAFQKATIKQPHK